MDNIIQVVVFMVIMAVVIMRQISKADKEKKTPSPKEVLADMFPEIEQERMGEEPPVSPAPAVHSTQPPRMQHRPIAPKTVAPSPTGNKRASRTPVRLSTQEEARRAFIYSEIFNRKYQ